MTAPNHIAGGIVITGVFCSLWNINIFSTPLFTFTTIFCSLLPDIDHTKSMIGKLFYPLSKWISRNHGHRTITHSLLFLFLLTVTSIALEKIIFESDFSFSIILFFSVFSHLLLDMMTVQGIPLFYPFMRNPCVIPHNPEYRIKTGNLKQEGIFFFVFALLALSFSNLIENGFWSTYNRQFNDITHIHREFKRNLNFLKIEYDFNRFQQKYVGNGYLVYADPNQLFIMNDTLISLNSNQQGLLIHSLNSNKTDDLIELKSFSFVNISLDSINSLFHHKFLPYLKITSSEKIDLIFREGIINNHYFELSNQYNLRFVPNLKIENQESKEEKKLKAFQDYKSKQEHIKKQLMEKEISLQIELDNIQNHNRIKHELVQSLSFAKKTLGNSDNLYEINEAKKEIILLEKQLNSFIIKKSNIAPKLKNQIYQLKKEIQKDFIYLDFNLPIEEKTKFSGFINYFEIPKF